MTRTLIALAAGALLYACADHDGEVVQVDPPAGEAEPAQGGNPADIIGEIGGMCGGFGGFQCKDENAYCAVEPGECVRVADYAGICEIKPEICTQQYAPVCGCDEETYSNACVAAAAGASVAYEGECRETG